MSTTSPPYSLAITSKHLRISLFFNRSVCSKFQEESGATDMEVKTLLRELARVYEKDIDDNYDIDWEV